MKQNIIVAILIATSLPLTGQESFKSYEPSGKIYRNGWIDLNKNGRKDIYEDPSQTVDRRIEDLLSQMTVEEKTCQMVTLYGYGRILQDDLPSEEWKNRLWKDGVGAIDEHLNGFRNWRLAPSDNQYVWPASRHTWAMNEVQRFFIEQTRLGIPVDFTNEGIRGVESLRSTNFPTQLGIGHTWDRDLVRRIGAVTGIEAKALGYTNVYSPILDVARDQRWGRFEESYGESPYLVAELGIQMAKGIQEDGGVASTAKHFLAYSANKGAREGLARTDPQISPREVEMIHAYPFQRVIRETGLMGIMCAYNDYDGVPIEGSSYWLTDRLRGKMGFKGYVVSDSDAVEYLYSKHSTAADMKEAVFQSVMAGLNVRCTFRSPDSYVLPLRELVSEGKIPVDIIDSRVRDILRVKFELGLFDKPYVKNLEESDRIVGAPEHQELALRASRESIVLLKNEGGLLPLERGKVRSIAVCGPNAAEESYAKTHYGPLDANVISVLEGLREGSGAEILYAKGCDLIDANWPESEITDFPLTPQEQEMIDEAVANALKADVSVVVLGGGIRTCGENKSRTSIDLPGRQELLLKAVCATGKPVVLILINGRPLSVNWADANVPAILEAWYPGSYGGQALTEIIFGDINPSGKLTCTFPRTVGQIPFNFPCKPNSQIGGNDRRGPDGAQSRINTALYNFGHGLSYTTFEYSDLVVKAAWTENRDHPVKVSLTVKNTGEREGDEIVQIYIKDVISSVTTYEKRLIGFERVHLAPGESRRVDFRIRRDAFEIIDRQFNRTIEPGDFRIMAGAASDDIRLESTITF